VIQLDPLLEFWQHWRHIGENILVAGLLVELIIVVIFHDSRRAERIGNVLATVLIIAGVIVENVAGGRADEVVRRMRAPRSFTIAERKKIVPCLKKLPQGKIFLIPKAFDEDAQQYAQKILALLKLGGCNAGPAPSGAPAPMSYGVPGAFIFVFDMKHAPPLAIALQQCFLSAGYLFNGGTLPKGSDSWVGPNDVVIGVGAKP
jgi:hypothetical protein